MIRLLSDNGLRHNENYIDPGAQPERRGEVGPMRARLGIKPAPAARFQEAKVRSSLERVAAAAAGAEDVVRGVVGDGAVADYRRAVETNIVNGAPSSLALLSERVQPLVVTLA
jgi:hypothetical protein